MERAVTVAAEPARVVDPPGQVDLSGKCMAFGREDTSLMAKDCAFPFVYKGFKHYGCITVDDDQVNDTRV